MASLDGYSHFRELPRLLAKYIATRAKILSVKYGLTIFLSYVGGLVDWIFYFYKGRLYLEEWTWMPQYSVFGTWNWKLQLCWSLCFLAIIAVLWKTEVISEC